MSATSSCSPRYGGGRQVHLVRCELLRESLSEAAVRGRTHHYPAISVARETRLGQHLAGSEAPTSRCSTACSASSKRSETPSLSKILCRWFFMVCSLRDSFAAMSEFLKPCAVRFTISRSRRLNIERSLSRCAVGRAGLAKSPG